MIFSQILLIGIVVVLRAKQLILKRIIFTVSNNLVFDQRMMRICNSLTSAGYLITIVGRKGKKDLPLSTKLYSQIRLFTFFAKGPAFYAEFNIRIFFYLLFRKADLVCSIDLDTILPVWLISKLKNIKRVYDAHEYFSQQKEVISRPIVYHVWAWIEKTFIPKFKYGYTVSQNIAASFNTKYGVTYEVIQNLPILTNLLYTIQKNEKLLIYQGSVNHARGLEFLIPAMKEINAVLHIYGDGNFMEQLKNLIDLNNVKDKVLLKGKVLPEQLNEITQSAYIGINLVENTGLNQYFSLANKFFDYIQNGIPQVTMNFPEYKKVNDQYEVAVLLDNLMTESIVKAIEKLLSDKVMYTRLNQNCLLARQTYNWTQGERKLIDFYNNIFIE